MKYVNLEAARRIWDEEEVDEWCDSLNGFLQELTASDSGVFGFLPENAQVVVYYLDGPEDAGFLFGLRPFSTPSAGFGKLSQCNVTSWFISTLDLRSEDDDAETVAISVGEELAALVPAYEKLWGTNARDL